MQEKNPRRRRDAHANDAPVDCPHTLTKTAEPWLGGGAAFGRRLARRREAGVGALGDYRRDGNRLQHDQTGRMNNLEDGLTSCEYRVFHEACRLASEGRSLAFSANSLRISANSLTISASFLTN